MASSIALNVGGTSASGASVFCRPASGAQPSQTLIGAADSNGAVTFSGLAAGSYQLSADTSPITSGTYKGKVYRSTVDIVVDGTTTYTGIVIPAPTAP